MINRIHAYFHDPARGWDPVGADYALAYGAKQVADISVVDRFERAVDGLNGKRVIDVASGPGHYAVEFARRGASVTCFDISRAYLRMAERRFSDAGLRAEYVCDYLDHIHTATAGAFDGIFSNIAWNYCMNDYSFAQALTKALAPAGKILIRETNEEFERNKGLLRGALYTLNRATGIKVGHLHPPQGRIEAAFERAGCRVEADYMDPLTDIVVATRKRSG